MCPSVNIIYFGLREDITLKFILNVQVYDSLEHKKIFASKSTKSKDIYWKNYYKLIIVNFMQNKWTLPKTKLYFSLIYNPKIDTELIQSRLGLDRLFNITFFPFMCVSGGI